MLLHQIPPKPAYFRVKIWRRLQQLGAVQLKNSVYVLPLRESCREDFEWVLREIVAGGGEGTLCEAKLADGMTDRQVVELFNAARDEDFAELTRSLRALEADRRSASASQRAELAVEVERLRRRIDEIATKDFFGSPGKKHAEAMIRRLEERLRGAKPPVETSRGPARMRTSSKFRHRTWITRKGIQVDRIASAWLIRRFIDPAAQFRFVDARVHRPRTGELRFDMFEAEFTHVGDSCTFEVLIDRMGLVDPALVPIREIIHDLDLKDGKFGRPEAAGIRALLAGIATPGRSDEERLAQGSQLFDGLYENFRNISRSTK